jgi:hypothetical protein
MGFHGSPIRGPESILACSSVGVVVSRLGEARASRQAPGWTPGTLSLPGAHSVLRSRLCRAPAVTGPTLNAEVK